MVTYNQNLFDAQWLTVQNDLNRAIEKLSALRQKLEDRVSGLQTRGKVPTVESIRKQAKACLHRQHMARLIDVTITETADGIPRLEYAVNTAALEQLTQTSLGKNILITNQAGWKDAAIIRAYRSQFIIEGVFKEMKDRTTGSWWPLFHWTDSKIQVHGLYCTIALLLRSLLLRRVHQAGVRLSMNRLLDELDDIREVVNVYPRKRRQKAESTQTVLTKTSDLQQKLLSILHLDKQKSVLG